MKYLKKFNTTTEYDQFKSGSEFVLPNVSFVVENTGVKFSPKARYLIKAKYNATDDNLHAFTVYDKNGIVSLTVNDKKVEFEPFNISTPKIVVEAKNIALVEEAYADEYGWSCSTITALESYFSSKELAGCKFKPKDSNYQITEKTFVCRLEMRPSSARISANVRSWTPLIENKDMYTTTDGITFTATQSGLSYINNTFYGGNYNSVVLCEFDENNNITFIDTEFYPTTYVGGISNYNFETPGQYNVEIEMYNEHFISIFNSSCLTDVVVCNGFTVFDSTVFGGCKQLKSVVFPKTITDIGYGIFNGCDLLQEITFYSTTAPDTALKAVAITHETGVFKYPKGSDYSAWIDLLPEGWTTEEF